jgi:cytochrome P450
VAIEFDPFSPEWRDDPYPLFRTLRDEAPVYWSEPSRIFCVSRYDDVMTLLKDTARFRPGPCSRNS